MRLKKDICELVSHFFVLCSGLIQSKAFVCVGFDKQGRQFTDLVLVGFLPLFTGLLVWSPLAAGSWDNANKLPSLPCQYSLLPTSVQPGLCTQRWAINIAFLQLNYLTPELLTDSIKDPYWGLLLQIGILIHPGTLRCYLPFINKMETHKENQIILNLWSSNFVSLSSGNNCGTLFPCFFSFLLHLPRQS